MFGADKHFYGPEGSAADANITKYENENQSTIQHIRNLADGFDIDPEFAASLITHLEIRSAFLREETSTKLRRGMKDAFGRFAEPDALRAMLLGNLQENPEQLGEFLDAKMVPADQRAAYRAIAPELIKRAADDDVLKHVQPGLRDIGRLIELFPEISKAAHNEVFARHSGFPCAVSHMGRRYSVWRLDSGSFILPDTTLAFIKRDGASPYSEKDDRIEAVIVPIASDVAIVGRNRLGIGYSLKTVNRILAGCAYKAFIAKERNPHFERLAGRIGKYARLMSDRDLDRIFRRATPLCPKRKQALRSR